MKELTGRELLKYMAQQAKNRMKSKNADMSLVTNYAKNRPIIISTRITEDEDNELYDRVCELLDNDKDCFNPIDKLMDIDEYNHMNLQGKERYLFNLAEKYRLFKDKYETEKLKKSV